MEWLWVWIAEIGTPAAMRPMTGMATESFAASSRRVCGSGALPRRPSMTFGRKPRWRIAAKLGLTASGRRITSSARARFGSRRMKPRSSSAVIRRWMPDLERRSSASFISSKDGGTPLSFRRSLMNRSSSSCLRVSIDPARPLLRDLVYKSRTDTTCSRSVPQYPLISREKLCKLNQRSGAAGRGTLLARRRRRARGSGGRSARRRRRASPSIEESCTGKGVAIELAVTPVSLART